MPTYIVTCKSCGAAFGPTNEAIRSGSWKVCPTCSLKPTHETNCRECGRVLRATTRELCLRCMGVNVL
jgi:hypothetical protein